MEIKDLEVRVKSDGDSGEFTAYAAVFGNIDSHGDVIVKGAFADTLMKWGVSDNSIPLLYGHDFHDPFSNIGAVTTAVEDEHGLKITAKLDLDNSKAKQVYRLIREKRIGQLSFAFDVVESGPVEVEGRKANELRKLTLYEVSVVLIGANQATEIISSKAAITESFAQAFERSIAEAVPALVESFSKALDNQSGPTPPPCDQLARLVAMEKEIS